MSAKATKEEPKARKVTFKCRICEDSKPLAEMVVLTGFFPLVVVCRDCDKKVR